MHNSIHPIFPNRMLCRKERKRGQKQCVHSGKFVIIQYFWMKTKLLSSHKRLELQSWLLLLLSYLPYHIPFIVCNGTYFNSSFFEILLLLWLLLRQCVDLHSIQTKNHLNRTCKYSPIQFYSYRIFPISHRSGVE